MVGLSSSEFGRLMQPEELMVASSGAAKGRALLTVPSHSAESKPPSESGFCQHARYV